MRRHLVCDGLHRRSAAALLCCLIAACSSTRHRAQAELSVMRYVNPPSLPPVAGYTHVIVAPDGRTVYIAGQIPADSAGRLVGLGDFRAQVEQVYANLRRALESVGGTLADLVLTTTFVTDVTQAPVLREVRAKVLDANHPPANTLIPVPVLARPGMLIEIEATAVLRAPVRP